MLEAEQLVATLKKQLKIQGMTYRDVARELKLSEPSVKRLFSSGRFTVERLVQICNLLGYTMAELSKEAEAGQARLSTLSEKQEHEVVSNPKLLMVAVCALNHWTLDEIVAAYQVEHAECIKYLLQLDKLRIIDLLPGNRIRINVSRDFDWLPGGPIRRYFQSGGLADFLKSDFAQEGESQAFVFGMLTEPAASQMHDELRRLRQRMAMLHEESLTAPLRKRYGFGLLLAMRDWEPTDFAQMRREKPSR